MKYLLAESQVQHVLLQHVQPLNASPLELLPLANVEHELL
jgi:hypothetical protein